jgi:hypothetical protein
MSTGARSRTYDTSSTLIWGLTRTQLLEVVLECYHVGRIVQSGYTKMAIQGPGVLVLCCRAFLYHIDPQRPASLFHRNDTGRRQRDTWSIMRVPSNTQLELLQLAVV